jgi:hypothetical protein
MNRRFRASFVGWRRKDGGEWEAVAAATRLETAAVRLLIRLREEGADGEGVILADGRTPGAMPRGVFRYYAGRPVPADD